MTGAGRRRGTACRRDRRKSPRGRRRSAIVGYPRRDRSSCRPGNARGLRSGWRSMSRGYRRDAACWRWCWRWFSPGAPTRSRRFRRVLAPRAGRARQWLGMSFCGEMRRRVRLVGVGGWGEDVARVAGGVHRPMEPCPDRPPSRWGGRCDRRRPARRRRGGARRGCRLSRVVHWGGSRPAHLGGYLGLPRPVPIRVSHPTMPEDSNEWGHAPFRRD